MRSQFRDAAQLLLLTVDVMSGSALPDPTPAQSERLKKAVWWFLVAAVVFTALVALVLYALFGKYLQPSG
jgi:hypothetical protein